MDESDSESTVSVFLLQAENVELNVNSNVELNEKTGGYRQV